jgi:hypothetical protein
MLIAAIAVAGVWILAVIGYRIAGGSVVTAEKLQAYVKSTDLGKLTGEARKKALKTLADKLNALSLEERRKARLDRTAFAWFEQMTEEEKGWFIEATLPTGFQQMLTAFEQLPEERRRRTVEDAVRRMRQGTANPGSGGERRGPDGTNAPPVLSKELEAKIRTAGLKALYSESSAQTKAELAPLLEEMQRVMEMGRPFR